MEIVVNMDWTAYNLAPDVIFIKTQKRKVFEVKTDNLGQNKPNTEWRLFDV